MTTFLTLLCIVLAALIFAAVQSFRAAAKLERSPDPIAEVTSPQRSESEQQETPSTDFMAIARDLETPMEEMAHPMDTLENPDFQRAVDAMSEEALPLRTVQNYARGRNWVLRCVAMQALERRGQPQTVLDTVFARLEKSWLVPLVFALRFIDKNADRPAIAPTLYAAQSWWPNNLTVLDELGRLLRRRLADESPLDFTTGAKPLSRDRREDIEALIAALPEEFRDAVNDAFESYAQTVVDDSYLRSIGKLLTESDADQDVFETDSLRQLHHQMVEILNRDRPQSIVVVGEPGVGKSALRDQFAKTLMGRAWRILKTSPTNLVADQKYVGEIEGQLRRLTVEAAVTKRVAIYVERFNELDQFGRTTGKQSSVLDQLWPAIEQRSIFLVSETTPDGLQTLQTRFPSFSSVVKIIRLGSATEAETRELGSQLLSAIQPDASTTEKHAVLNEAVQVAQQYFSHRAFPGGVLSLVKLSALTARDAGQARIYREHVLGALSQLSGLPTDVLDEQQKLDVAQVRDVFAQRIFGQEEAVDCLVERIAMLKAGLTDPSRPVGVFLFAGPTGTGKTEIAKTLAAYLFGSREQMIRLDMSEYQSADSAWRLISDDSDKALAGGSLTTKIRQKPFSVVLLDEFEKAHSKVWDMFLQVFDDGRLSDAKGAVADFRHSIIILTSNLGSTISAERGVGFTGKRGEFSANEVMRTVNRTFRREFVNRLDRTVVFKPLSRNVMRGILRKELRLALDRRGLRTKRWAVEWEDSAIEFLLNEGFTPDLGARPLRRAIEQHLLVPLSITMVQNEAPSGEQFLFVRSDGDALQVEFIDPDADVEDIDHGVADDSLALTQILQAGTPPAGSVTYLRSAISEIAERIDAPDWLEEKAARLAEMSDEEFWSRDERFTTLDRVELMDRVENATTTLERLSQRLSASSTGLTQRVASRLFALREGLKDFEYRRPTQAFIGIRLVTDDKELPAARPFRNRIIDMYRQWAKRRGMRIQVLPTAASRYHTLLKITGFGSFGLVEQESGLHVFEVPAGDSQFDRIRVRVQVAPLPQQPEEFTSDGGQRATEIVDGFKSGKVVIVRRYREAPSPLARDSIRGWRTGRLEFLLEGNFDILSDG
ncbi:MAG: AAA family ATPase [Pseudomonadota bacterium]